MKTSTSTHPVKCKWNLKFIVHFVFLTALFVSLSFNYVFAPHYKLFDDKIVHYQGPGVNMHSTVNPVPFSFSTCHEHWHMTDIVSPVPLPTLGNTLNGVATFTGHTELSLTGLGGPFTLYNFNGNFQFSANHVADTGNKMFFEVEMLAMNLTGGTLPPNIQLRESPVRQSKGMRTSQNLGTGFLIESFFDIYFEISLDGGLSWTSAIGQPPTHIELTGDPVPSSIPFAGTWGKIILFSCLLLSGFFFLFRSRVV